MDRRKLSRIDEELESSEVAALCFLCRDVLNRSPFMSIEDGKKLFLRLEEKGLLKNNAFLRQLLQTIHRVELLNLLETDSRRPEETDANPMLSEYRVVLYKVYEDLTQENLEKLKFLLSNKLGRRQIDACNTTLDVFAEMERHGLLSNTNLRELHTALLELDQQLASTIQRYMEELPGQSQPGLSPHVSMDYQMGNNTPQRPEPIDMSISESQPSCGGVSVYSDAAPNTEAPSLHDHTDYYALTHIPRGLCVVINNEVFLGTELGGRAGTQEDEKALSAVFSLLGFTVVVHNNLTAGDMGLELQKLASRSFLDEDALVVCVLSHGENGCVFGTGSICIQEVCRQLTRSAERLSMSAKDTVRRNKTAIQMTLCGNHRLILNKVYENDLITDIEYNNLKSINKEDVEGHVIELVDKLMNKGEDCCRAFLDLLQTDKDVIRTYPELKKIPLSGPCVLPQPVQVSAVDDSHVLPPASKRKKEDKSYELNSRPTGLCVIINNENFTYNKVRGGTDKDAQCLAEVFSWLGFRALMCKDQTKDQMDRVLECFASQGDLSQLQEFGVKEWSGGGFTDLQEAPKHGDAFICLVLSHGEKDLPLTTLLTCTLLVLSKGYGQQQAMNVIVSKLRGEFSVPVAERTRAQNMYMYVCSLSQDGQTLLCAGKPVTLTSEVGRMDQNGLDDMKGSGARKLNKRMNEQYSGISQRKIQEVLEGSKNYQLYRARFANKHIPRPIRAKEVQDRHQVDLLDMGKMRISHGHSTYRYILMVIDVFSCYVWLRPLKGKESAEIAKRLHDIYLEHGPPNVLQHDRGAKFKGTVRRLMESMQVRIIESSPCHPQSQGKVERSHIILRKKIMYDLVNFQKGGVNWVKHLPVYSRVLNEKPKEVLGGMSPFDVYYGRKSKRVVNPLAGCPSLKQRGNFEVEETEKKGKRKPLSTVIMSTEYCHNRMIINASKQNPPSVYHVGDAVLLSKYKVQFQIPGDPKMQVKWFFVSDVTSTTRLQERTRSESSKSAKPLHPHLILYTHGDRLEDFMSLQLWLSQFRIRFDPAPDGNCQFSAISDQLATHRIFRSAETLRDEIVQDLRSNPFTSNGIPLLNFVDGNDWDGYLDSMSQCGTYGDHITLQRAAEMFNVQFLIVSSLGVDASSIISHSNRYCDSSPLLVLGHIAEGHGKHYLSLE